MAVRYGFTLAIAIGCATLAGVLSQLAFANPDLATETVTQRLPLSQYHYSGDVQIDPETTHLAAAWTITLDDPDTRSLTYWLSANFDTLEVTGADVEAYSTGPAGPPGVQAVTIELSDHTDAPRQIEIGYSGVLFPEPMENQINSISPRKVEFTVDSFWQPFDARFSARITADLRLQIPGDWTPVTTGYAEGRAEEIAFLFDRPTLDLPLTLLSDFTEVHTDTYRILDTRPGEADLTALAETAAFCTEYLNARYSARETLPQANIVLRPSSGYARGTLIALSETGRGEGPDTTKFVCHEFAHFWSSNGVPITVENWLNESFAELVGLMAVRERYGEGAFEAVVSSWQARLTTMGEVGSVWSPDDLSRRSYAVNYIKGPLALAALEDRIGREAFAQFVARYMVERIATTPDLLAMLEEVAGREHRDWFETALGE